MKSIILLSLVFFLHLQLTTSAYCHGSPKEYFVNNEPVWKEEPHLIRAHKYGKLYEIGNDTTTMKLLHVYGNMYQMGFAHGELLKT